MPIYEYHCEECGTDFERLVRRSDEKVVCDCGSGKLRKRFSVFAAHVTTGSSAKKPSAACETCSLGGTCGLS